MINDMLMIIASIIVGIVIGVFLSTKKKNHNPQEMPNQVSSFSETMPEDVSSFSETMPEDNSIKSLPKKKI